MRKNYFFIVFLILLFLGTLVLTNNALASCDIQQDYNCTYVYTCDGVVQDTGSTCVDLCTWYNSNSYMTDFDYFSCILTQLTPKYLLGEGSSPSDGNLGCLVEIKGKKDLLIINLTSACPSVFNSCIYNLKCSPCNGCCSP